MAKKVSILFMIVATVGMTLVACGKNNNYDRYGYGYDPYNGRNVYNQGQYGRHLRRLPHGQSSCGSGWNTAFHHTQQRGFCFEAGFDFGFQIDPWQEYHGLLCDVRYDGLSSCPQGMFCQTAPGRGHLGQPLGFCTYRIFW